MSTNFILKSFDILNIFAKVTLIVDSIKQLTIESKGIVKGKVLVSNLIATLVFVKIIKMIFSFQLNFRKGKNGLPRINNLRAVQFPT